MTLELFGMARELVGAPDVELDVAEPATLRSLLGELARRYPKLSGAVLDPDTHAPIEPHALLLDGRRASGMDEPVRAADRPVLLIIPSGG
jgi:molybdopterin converting factor small subunit